MDTAPGYGAAAPTATEPMFEIVCSVDHQPYGAAAGRVFARVRELGDTLERYAAAHPGCELTAVRVNAPIGSQHGELPPPETSAKYRGSAVSFEQPVRPEQPVYPRGRS